VPKDTPATAAASAIVKVLVEHEMQTWRWRADNRPSARISRAVSSAPTSAVAGSGLPSTGSGPKQ